MILVIDIGNTNTVLGGMEGEQLQFTLRIQSDRLKTADEYLLTIKGLLELQGVTPAQIEGGIISSVVPELKNVMGRAMKKLTGRQFLVVGSGVETGLRIKTDDPSKLGSDLVVDAVAALASGFPWIPCPPGRHSCPTSTWMSRNSSSAPTPFPVCRLARFTATPP